MSRPAAIPYFGDAYLADTRHLSLEEHGAYHLLILIAWRSDNCALPDDDRRLAQMLGVTAKKWAKLKPVVMAFWTRTENGFEQKRLTKEFRYVTKSREQNSDAANARWQAKRLKDKGGHDADASPAHMRNGCESDAPPPPPPLEERVEAKASTPVAKATEPTRAELEELHVFRPVVDAWNAIADRADLPPARWPLNDGRKGQIRQRVVEHGLDTVLKEIADIPTRRRFLGGNPVTQWRPDLGKLMGRDKFTGLLEGRYDRPRSQPRDATASGTSTIRNPILRAELERAGKPDFGEGTGCEQLYDARIVPIRRQASD